MSTKIKNAKDAFEEIVISEIKRVEKMKEDQNFIDYQKVDKIIIGIVGGDGIGPYIVKEAQKILEFTLKEEIENGKISIKPIEGLTIENRAEKRQALPDEVLKQLKGCHVILKGPTTTPQTGDKWPNIESANVAMRRRLDLFANIRPVKVPKQNVDWVFFRENTEGAYILGSRGIDVTSDLALDFKSITTQGAERIIRTAFEYGRQNNRKRLTVVTKANVVKTTDGKFLRTAQEISREYPEITLDEWYIDIMAAKLLDPKRRSAFDLIVLPNLYGDILTDEAAQLQGGVGTAGSANIGKRYAMFEAIHGSAPRMVREGRAEYADPSSMIRAAAMLLEHINYRSRARKLTKALDLCSIYERKITVTGQPEGATGEEFTSYLQNTLLDPLLEEKWERYAKK